MSLRNGRYCCFFLVLFCAGVLPGGQNPAGEQAGFPSCANFRADTNLVNVPVNVFDSQNRIVNHLDAKYFRIFEDGIEQQIVGVGEDDTPASIGFVFDTSASIGAKLDLSRQAIAEFLKSANPQDEFFFLPFGSQPGAVTGFTSRPEEILDQVARAKSGGTTAMLDAIRAAFLNIRKAHNARRAVIIISDGGDNHSRATKTEIRRMAREADAQVYALGTYQPPGVRRRTAEELTGPELLTEISEQNGGRSFPVQKPYDIVDAAIRIGIELRDQYLIQYRPSNQNWNGMYRRIAVEVAPPGFPQLRAYWRQGYYAAELSCAVPTS
ncbi:MAG: VWA domain-containing protein [Bryobacteraceae bacterium]|jgi:VWFA-related protein